MDKGDNYNLAHRLHSADEDMLAQRVKGLAQGHSGDKVTDTKMGEVTPLFLNSGVWLPVPPLAQPHCLWAPLITWLQYAGEKGRQGEL